MPRWSGEGRAQTEPLAALAAVAALGVALALYAGVLSDVLVASEQDGVAERTLDRVRRVASDAGVVNASRLDAARDVGPPRRGLNVTLTVGEDRWAAGPVPNGTVAGAARAVPVAREPGTVVRGRLEVRLWR